MRLRFGSVGRSVVAEVVAGLDFEGNSAAQETGDRVGFRWVNPQNAGFDWLDTTIIWRCYVRAQTVGPGNTPSPRGYMSMIFWASDDGSGGFSNWVPDSRDGNRNPWGFHPYPVDAEGSVSNTTLDRHRWEIADGGDTVSTEEVEYQRWYTQVIRISGAVGQPKTLEYFTDYGNYGLSTTDGYIRRDWTANQSDTLPENPTLMVGYAAWEPDNELYSGIVRGYQIYSRSLSDAEVNAEISEPLSSAGAAIWYLNLNPTPTDISDKSGNGNDPSWVSALRPSLWSG